MDPRADMMTAVEKRKIPFEFHDKSLNAIRVYPMRPKSPAHTIILVLITHTVLGSN
jgi:hypothetical protein